MSPVVRTVAIPAAVAFAILVPAIQSIADLGLSPSEFADQGDRTLRAAGYAFSIWGVIYVGLVVYAVWQALPRNRRDPALDAVAPAALVAILGCGVWIAASALDLKWPSVAIIVVSAVALTASLLRGEPADADLKNLVLAWGPLNLLAGWLTIASALNILTVLTAIGALNGIENLAAYAGVVGVLIAALFVLRRSRSPIYGVPVAWGLAAVWAAEKADKPNVALVALAAAILVAGYAAWQFVSLRRARQA